MLETLTVAPLEVKLRNTSTQIKHRIWVRRPDGRRVHLCTPFETEARAQTALLLRQRTVTDEVRSRRTAGLVTNAQRRSDSFSPGTCRV